MPRGQFPLAILTNSYFTNSEVQSTLENKKQINEFEKSELGKAKEDMRNETQKLNDCKEDIYTTLTSGYYKTHAVSDAQTITNQTLKQTANTSTYLKYSDTISKVFQTAEPAPASMMGEGISGSYSFTPIDVIKLAKEGIYPEPILIKEEEKEKLDNLQTKLSDILIKEGRERLPEYEYGVETQGTFYEEGKKVKAEKIAGYFKEEELKEYAELYSQNLTLMREEREVAGSYDEGKRNAGETLTKKNEDINEERNESYDELHTSNEYQELLVSFQQNQSADSQTQEKIDKKATEIETGSASRLQVANKEYEEALKNLQNLARTYALDKSEANKQVLDANLQEIERRREEIERIMTSSI